MTNCNSQTSSRKKIHSRRSACKLCELRNLIGQFEHTMVQIYIYNKTSNGNFESNYNVIERINSHKRNRDQLEYTAPMRPDKIK